MAEWKSRLNNPGVRMRGTPLGDAMAAAQTLPQMAPEHGPAASPGLTNFSAPAGSPEPVRAAVDQMRQMLETRGSHGP